MAVASHLDAAYPQLKRPGSSLAAYLALLRLGVTVPRLLPGARWALTPPFHPYPSIRGGLFSVALSVASRRPGVTWQSTLWSSDFPQRTLHTGAPRPSHPTATSKETYRRHHARGKATAPAAAAAAPGCRSATALRRTARAWKPPRSSIA